MPNRIVHSPHSYVFFDLIGIVSTNAGHIPFLDVLGSWPWLAWWSFLIDFFVVLPSLLVLIRFWQRLDRPKITFVRWVRALTAWLSLFFLFNMILNLVKFAGMKHGTGRCGYQADTEYWPSAMWYLGVALLLLLISFSTLISVQIIEQQCPFLASVWPWPNDPDDVLQFREMGTLGQRLYCKVQIDDSETEAMLDFTGTPHSARMLEMKGPDLSSEEVEGEDKQAQLWNQNIQTKRFLNCVAAAGTLFVGLIAFGSFAEFASTQMYFDYASDHNFGFVLQEGQPYTAPVFIGEFGSDTDSEYFQQGISYFASRELDWAYWPLNPMRPYGGFIGPNGYETGDGDPNRMVEDTWSILDKDWYSIRYPWMLERLMRVMRQPSMVAADIIPCNRLANPNCGH